MSHRIVIHPNMQGYKDVTDQIGAILITGSPCTVSIEAGEKKKRTGQQNNAMHKYFEMLASELNGAGFDMKKTLKETVDIPWTPESVKKHLWKPIQKAMIEKASTTQLDKLDVSAVYDVLNRHLSDKTGVSVPFPSRDL